MADFTRVLSGNVQSKRPVPVSKDISGTVNSLVRGAGNVVDVFNNQSKINAANKKAALEAREAAALDDLARTSFDAMTTPEGKEINRINNAIKSGSTSSLSGRSRLDTQIRSLLNQYPDMAFEMFQQFDELGIESRLFREYRAQEAELDQRELDQRNANSAARQAVSSRGIDTSLMSDAEVLTLGRNFMSDESDFQRYKEMQEYLFFLEDQDMQRASELRAQRTEERNEAAERRSQRGEARQEAAAQREQARFNQWQRDQQIIESNRGALNALTTMNSRVLPNAVARFSQMARESDGSLESLANLDAFAQQMVTDLRLMEASGLQELSSLPNMTQSTLDNYSKSIQQMVDIVENVNNGDLSQRQLMANSIEDFTNNTRILWNDQAPVLSSYVSIFGGQGAAMFIAGDAGVGAKFADKAGTELGRFLDKVETSAETGSANGDSDVAGFWNSTRQRLKQGFTPEMTEAYIRSVLVSTNEVPAVGSMSNGEAATVISDLVSPGTGNIIRQIRQEDPERAMIMESAQAEAIGKSIETIIRRGGVTSFDREGVTEGTIDQNFALGGALSGQPTFGKFGTASQETAGIKWDNERNVFVGFGNELQRSQANTLNSGLMYMKDYYTHYGLGSEDELVQFLIYNEYPELAPPSQDTTGTINNAAESLPQ